MKRIALLPVIALCALLFLGSCKEEDKQEPFRIVRLTFVTNGGTAVDKIVSKANRVIAQPADPKKEGYSLEGWFSDEGLTQPFDFSQPVQQDATLYAKWKLGVYTVTIEARGGNAIAAQQVNYNQTMSAVTGTHPNGYTFKELRDIEGKVFDITTPIKDALTLYAIWNMPTDLFDVVDGTCGGLKAAYKSTLQYVDIPDGIPGVVTPLLYTNAFKDDTRIVSVSLPATYTELGGYAFQGCTNLKTVFAYGVQKYQTTVFKESGIEHLRIPGTALWINDSFTYMAQLKEITVYEAPAANVAIPLDFQGSGYVFWESPNVEKITFLRTTAPTVVAGGGPMFSAVTKLQWVHVPAASLADYQTNWANTAIASKISGI